MKVYYFVLQRAKDDAGAGPSSSVEAPLLGQVSAPSTASGSLPSHVPVTGSSSAAEQPCPQVVRFFSSNHLSHLHFKN